MQALLELQSSDVEALTSLQPAERAVLLSALDDLHEREVLPKKTRCSPGLLAIWSSCLTHPPTRASPSAGAWLMVQAVESKGTRSTMMSFGRSGSAISSQLPPLKPDTSGPAHPTPPAPATPPEPTPDTPMAAAAQGPEDTAVASRTHSTSTADASQDGLQPSSASDRADSLVLPAPQRGSLLLAQCSEQQTAAARRLYTEVRADGAVTFPQLPPASIAP